MKFNINLTKNDFVIFQKYATGRISNSPPLKWKVTLFLIVYWCLLTVFVLEMFSVYDNDCFYKYSHLNRALIILAIWFFLSILWQNIYTKLYVNAAASDNGSVLGEWEFEISDDAITETNERCSSTFKWGCIESVEKDSNSLYIFTDKMKALILPLSQINEEIESFINKNVTSI